jgi:hypothetical protein
MNGNRRTLVRLLALLLLALAPAARGQSGLPKPEDVLGFKVGEDYRLATYDQAIGYWNAVAARSDRIKLFEAGRTSMGKAMTYAVISSPENLALLDRYKDIARRLSRVEGLDQAAAEGLAAEGKAIVYIDGGLHASECAPAQHNIQLTYDLLAGSDPRTLRFLRDVILVLVYANPDGMNLLQEWYASNLGTPYEVSWMPRLYHKYAGHDNNRDSYIANLVETQNLSRLINADWAPVIVYNHHQTAPFPARIWTPPNSEPTNPNVHPLIVRWQNLIGSAMGAAFDAEGKEGAISRIVFDTWYPGYMTQVHDSHNIVSILTETALYEYATPHFYTVEDFPKEYRDLTMSAFYPSPWKGGWWRLRDAVDYCLTASKAVLDVASKYRAELLFNKYKMGRDVVERFRKEPPFAWIVPPDQADPGAAALLLDRMILLGIDVFRSREEFVSDGVRYPAGTFIVPTDQPNGLFLKNVFEEQRYPDMRKYPDLWQGIVTSRKFEGAPFESYDMMGWTLPFQFGVKAVAAGGPVLASRERLEKVEPPAGALTGPGRRAYAIGHETNASFIAAARVFKAGGELRWAKAPFKAQGREFPSGTWIAGGPRLTPDFMTRLAKDLSLPVTGLSEAPPVATWSLREPRVALYESWVASEDMGWTKYVLDRFEIPYASLHDADIKAGNLNANHDVIVIPDMWSQEFLVDGFPKGTLPPAYVGGLTANGVRNLKLFADEGGTLVFLNGTCRFAISQFGLPARNVLDGVKREDFVCSGSLLRAEFDATQPVAYGMPKEGAVVFSDSCALEILPAFDVKKEPRSAARFAAENLLMSGWIHGERLIARKSAVLDVPFGRGRIVLLGVPVQYRAQPYGTFKLLFNSLFLAAAGAGSGPAS